MLAIVGVVVIVGALLGVGTTVVKSDQNVVQHETSVQQKYNS